MPIHDGCRQRQKELAQVGPDLTVAQAAVLSGADLENRALVINSGLPNGSNPVLMEQTTVGASYRKGATTTQKALATVVGLSDAAAGALSGADLQQAVNANLAGTTVGAGKDGAYLTQQRGGSGA